MNVESNTNKQIITDSLRLIKHCPACSSNYTLKDAKLVEDAEEGALVHFTCTSCLSSLLANIAELPFGVIGSAMLTDLEADEVLKFKDGEEVTVDDVLEVYQNLEKSDIKNQK